MTDVAVEDAVTAYLQRKSVGDPDGDGAGTYASNAESILRRWSEWLEAEHEVESLFDLEDTHLRSYAMELTDRVDEKEYTASTAQTYYAVVRAFLSWCVHGGILDTNPATSIDATDELPDDTGSTPDRAWTPTQRRTLEAYVRDRSVEAEKAPREERLGRLRDYAMVAVLAHSGVRGAELFRVPEDERRTGATWDDVDFYSGTIRVLGTSQRLQDVPLPGPARTPLRRYWIVLDPPSNDWPLFPTRHAPSIAKRVRNVLERRGFDESTIDELFDGATGIELAREYDIPPPAITTEGARSILKRLCANADVDVDGDYLTPRGARRGIDQSYRRDATSARTALREDFLEQDIALFEDDGTREP